MDPDEKNGFSLPDTTAFRNEMLEYISKSKGDSFSYYACLCQWADHHLPKDPSNGYQRLRYNGYICKDESDVALYIRKVADKHRPKFKALYKKLFQTDRSLFTQNLELVVWGCGCGLDLLALYDQAKQENNPVFWCSVSSITLIDISKTALAIAKELARMLFPMASLYSQPCDLKRPVEKISFRESDDAGKALFHFPLTPRLHLCSNLIDIFSDRELDNLSEVIRKYVRSFSFSNEYMLAFSPTYNHAEEKMELLQRALVEKGTTVTPLGRLGDDLPEKCAYALFRFAMTPGLADFYEKSLNNPFFKSLRKVGEKSKLPLAWVDGLWTDLQGTYRRMTGRSIDDDYQTAVLRDQVLCLLPVPGSRRRMIAILIRNKAFLPLPEGKEGSCPYALRPTLELIRKAWEAVHPPSQEPVMAIGRLLEVIAGAMSPLPIGAQYATWEEGLSKYYESSALRQGDPNTGVHLSKELLHLQVTRILDFFQQFQYGWWNSTSMDCTGLGRSCQKIAKVTPYLCEDAKIRLANQLFAEVEKDESVPDLPAKSQYKSYITFWSWDGNGPLCHGSTDSKALDIPEGSASFNFHDLFFLRASEEVTPLEDYKESGTALQRQIIEGRRPFRKVRGGPGSGKTFTLIWRAIRFYLETHQPVLMTGATHSLLNHNRELLIATLRKRFPAFANIDLARELFTFKTAQYFDWHLNYGGDQTYIDSFYGLVLMDELQVIAPHMAKEIFDHTGKINADRQCCVFCDEEQTLHYNKDALVHNDESRDRTHKTKFIKAPGEGFGRYLTLRENHRSDNLELQKLLRAYQKGFEKEYDIRSIRMEPRGDYGGDLWQVDHFRYLTVPDGHTFAQCMAAVGRTIIELREQSQDDTIVIISPTQRATEKIHEWLVTVSPFKDEEVLTTHYTFARILAERGGALSSIHSKKEREKLKNRKKKAEERARKRFLERKGRIHVTTIDCAQGHTFRNVIFYFEPSTTKPTSQEEIFTAISRARYFLRIIDTTKDQVLKPFLDRDAVQVPASPR